MWAKGQVVRLEKLELATGATVEFDSVLMVVNGEDVKIGAPVVAGAKVVAEVVAQGRGDKVKIVKFRRRKHGRKTRSSSVVHRSENHWDSKRIISEEIKWMATKKLVVQLVTVVILKLNALVLNVSVANLY